VWAPNFLQVDSVVAVAGGGRRQIGRASFRLANVSINAKSILQSLEELEPLAVLMPANPKEREKYVATTTASFVYEFLENWCHENSKYK
jgi:hypothetical protein